MGVGGGGGGGGGGGVGVGGGVGGTLQVLGDITNTIFGHALKSVTLVC